MTRPASHRILCVQVLRQTVWPYFAHFSREDIKAGYPWKLLRMQDTERALYIGGSASLESTLFLS